MGRGRRSRRARPPGGETGSSAGQVCTRLEVLETRIARRVKKVGELPIAVMAIANGKPTESHQLALASRGSDEGNGHYSHDCSASYRLVSAPHGAQWIELVGHGHVPDADDRCPKDGRHVYAWKGGKLIER